MRTIRVELQADLGSGSTVRVSTESVVNDDEAHQAGKETSEVLTEFMAGYGEAQ